MERESPPPGNRHSLPFFSLAASRTHMQACTRTHTPTSQHIHHTHTHSTLYQLFKNTAPPPCYSEDGWWFCRVFTVCVFSPPMPEGKALPWSIRQLQDVSRGRPWSLVGGWRPSWPREAVICLRLGSDFFRSHSHTEFVSIHHPQISLSPCWLSETRLFFWAGFRQDFSCHSNTTRVKSLGGVCIILSWKTSP